MERRRPSKCPCCDSEKIGSIAYGLLSEDGIEEVKRQGGICGGCELRWDNPDWYCNDCQLRWYDINDPEKIQVIRNWFKLFGLSGDVVSRK